MYTPNLRALLELGIACSEHSGIRIGKEAAAILQKSSSVFGALVNEDPTL